MAVSEAVAVVSIVSPTLMDIVTGWLTSSLHVASDVPSRPVRQSDQSSHSIHLLEEFGFRVFVPRDLLQLLDGSEIITTYAGTPLVMGNSSGDDCTARSSRKAGRDRQYHRVYCIRQSLVRNRRLVSRGRWQISPVIRCVEDRATHLISDITVPVDGGSKLQLSCGIAHEKDRSIRGSGYVRHKYNPFVSNTGPNSGS
jgi:hypothetical protein